MGIYGWHDNSLYAYNVVVDNDLTIKGTLTFGDAATDNLIIKGRLSSLTAAGSAIQITSAYAYGEGIEMRYQVTDWTGVGSSFKGLYLRSEAITTAASGKSIYGAEVYGVCNNVTMTTGSLWGALFYAYVKGVGAVTVNNMYAVQGELSWDASRTGDCTITTAAACFRAKITGGRVADYTKIHGYELTIGEMDGDSAKFGKGLFMQDDSGMSGTCTLTTGIDIAIGCTTGISIGNSTTGISIGDCVKGIEIGTFASPVTVQNSDWDTVGGAYTITKAMVSGCLNEDLSDSQCVRQLWSRFKITASQSAGSGKDYYGGEMQVRPHTGSAAIELAGGTYAGVWNYWENSDSAHALTVSGGYHYGSINMVELCSTGVISGGTFAAANMTNHVDTDPASATLFDAILINKVSGAYDWKIGVDVNDCTTGIDIGACTTAISIGDCVVGTTIGTFSSPVTCQNTDYVASGSAYSITKSMISGVVEEEIGAGYAIRQLWSRLKVTADQDGGKDAHFYGACLQTRIHTGVAAVAIDDGTYAGTWNYLENSDSGYDLTIGGGNFYGSRNMVELISSAVVNGGTFAGAEFTNHVDCSMTSATKFDAIFIDKISGAQDWKIGVDINDSTTGIQIGDATTGIQLDGTFSGNAIAVTQDALTVGDSYSGVRVAVTAAAPTNAYGMAAYFDTTVTGTQADNIYNTGSWVNMGAGYTCAANKLTVAFEGGIYDGGATLTDAWFIGLQLQMVTASAPTTRNWFRFNYNDGSSGSMTAIFAAANPGSAAFASGAGTTSTKNGDIAIADIVGTGVVYVRTYDAAG